MTWTVTTAPTAYPITLSDAKSYLRYDESDKDAEILSMLAAATDYCEEELDLAIMPQTITLKLDEFPSGREITLPRSNLISVTSVSYLDADGATQAFTDFTTRLSVPGTLVNNTEDWPETKDVAGAVTIVYQAGFATVPEVVKQAIKYMLTSFFDQRSPVVVGASVQEAPLTVTHLLQKYRRIGL